MAASTSNDSGLPPAEHTRIVRLLTSYSAIAFVYVAISAPLYLFIQSNIPAGLVYVFMTLATGLTLVHIRLTKQTRLAAFVICLVAATTVSVLALTGSSASSGTYSVFGATIFMFFMPYRRQYITIIIGMYVFFAIVYVLSLFGRVTLPYSAGNFGFFLLSLGFDTILLVLYGKEKSLLDQKLQAALGEASRLTLRLQHEKASVEHKVHVRTAQYQAEHAKLAASIGSLEQGFILVDAHQVVELTNKAASVLLGADTSSLRNLPLTDAVAHATWDIDLVKTTAGVLHSRRASQLNAATHDGRFLRLFVTPVIANKEVLGATVVIEDVTQQKILDRSRDEFFSIASHELRTPLTAIRGNMSMARDYYTEAMKDSKLRDLVDDTHAASVRLIQIVNDFLDSSKLEQGKMYFNLQPVAIGPLVTAIASDLAVIVKAQHNSLVLERVQDLPEVLADEDRLRQIVYNLLSNANKYTEGGTISVVGEVDGKQVRLRVIDNGKGISAENQQLLFRKFQQAGDNILTRDSTKGTGLGLYISKLLATNMKGDVILEKSEVGKGSTFTLTMPVAEA